MESSLLLTILVKIIFLTTIGLFVYILFRKFKKKKESTATIPTPNKNAPIVTKDIPGNKKIFINYRKEDSSGYSLALYNELLKWYDKHTIFKDFHNIEPGEDFEEAIDNALNSCTILLVIISDKWMNILQQRQHKIQQEDFVIMEIASALSKNIYTIPITINDAGMPAEADLPEELKKLTRRQYLNIDQTRFENDILQLVRVIDKKLGIIRNTK